MTAIKHDQHKHNGILNYGHLKETIDGHKPSNIIEDILRNTVVVTDIN